MIDSTRTHFHTICCLAITLTTDTFPLVTHTGFQAPSRSHFCLPSAVIKFMQTPSSTSNNDHSESGSLAALNFGVRAVEGGGCRLSGFLKSCLTEPWRVKCEIKVFSVCSNPTRETMFLTHSRKFFSARPTYNKTVISVGGNDKNRQDTHSTFTPCRNLTNNHPVPVRADIFSLHYYPLSTIRLPSSTFPMSKCTT
jgi:hypothetical protein